MQEDEEEEIIVPDLSKYDEAKDDSGVVEFEMRPNIDQRFKSTFVKDVIYAVLYENLNGKVYAEENIEELTKLIANSIRGSLEGKIYDRYKLIVHVELGEQRGAGLKTIARCLWDPECDSYATNSYLNDTLFCMAAVFGVYFY